MKKYICILLVLLLFLTGCGSVDSNKPVDHKKPAETKSVDHEIYPKQVMEALDIIKYFKAAASIDVGDETFVIISFGQKPGSGYGAKITEILTGENNITFMAEPGAAKDPSAEIMSFDYMVEVIRNEGKQIEVKVPDVYMPKVFGLDSYHYELLTYADNIAILGFTNDQERIGVSGIASIWEACFFYELQDKEGSGLKEGTVMAEAGAPDWGFFNLEIPELPENASSLVFLEENAKTGEHEELLRLDLKQEELEKTERQTYNPTDIKDRGEQQENQYLSVIKEKMQLGLTKESVKKLLGDGFIKVKNSMDDSEIWRYDMEAKEGYISPDDEYDTGDIEGLKKGDLKMQLFIQWNDKDKVEWYSGIYLNNSDERVYDYRIMSNGEEKHQPITD